PHSGWRSTGPEAFLQRYSWANRITLCELPPFPGSRLSALYFGFVETCRQARLRQALERKSDLVFANYVFIDPLLDFLPPSCPRMVETHDVHSHQLTLFDGHQAVPDERPAWLSRAKRDYLFRLEMNLLRLYDTVLMITADDLATVSQAGVDH